MAIPNMMNCKRPQQLLKDVCRRGRCAQDVIMMQYGGSRSNMSARHDEEAPGRGCQGRLHGTGQPQHPSLVINITRQAQSCIVAELPLALLRRASGGTYDRERILRRVLALGLGWRLPIPATRGMDDWMYVRSVAAVQTEPIVHKPSCCKGCRGALVRLGLPGEFDLLLLLRPIGT